MSLNSIKYKTTAKKLILHFFSNILPRCHSVTVGYQQILHTPASRCLNPFYWICYSLDFDYIIIKHKLKLDLVYDEPTSIEL